MATSTTTVAAAAATSPPPPSSPLLSSSPSPTTTKSASSKATAVASNIATIVIDTAKHSTTIVCRQWAHISSMTGIDDRVAIVRHRIRRAKNRAHFTLMSTKWRIRHRARQCYHQQVVQRLARLTHERVHLDVLL